MCGQESEVLSTPLIGMPGYSLRALANTPCAYIGDIGASSTSTPSSCLISVAFHAPRYSSIPGASSTRCLSLNSRFQPFDCALFAATAASIAKAFSSSFVLKLASRICIDCHSKPLRCSMRLVGSTMPPSNFQLS